MQRGHAAQWHQVQTQLDACSFVSWHHAWHDAKSESSSSFGLHEGGGKGGEGGGLAGGGGLGSGAHGKGGGGSSGGDGGNEGDTQNWHEWHAHHGQCWCLALAMHHERHSETAQWPVASGR